MNTKHTFKTMGTDKLAQQWTIAKAADAAQPAFNIALMKTFPENRKSKKHLSVLDLSTH